MLYSYSYTNTGRVHAADIPQILVFNRQTRRFVASILTDSTFLQRRALEEAFLRNTPLIGVAPFHYRPAGIFPHPSENFLPNNLIF